MNDDVKDFLQSCRTNYAANTLDGKKKHLQRYFHWLERKRLNHHSITLRHAEKYLLTLTPNMRRQALCTLNQFYYFIDCKHNPFEDIVIGSPYPAPLPKKTPSQNAIARIIATIDDPREELALRKRLIIELAYGSGLRRNELSKLMIEDIDINNATVEILHGKGNKRRVVPVTAKALETMREYLRIRKATRGPLIALYKKNSAVAAYTINKIVRQATGYGPHALRHACATHMLKAGCGLRHIQELLGHVKLSTTQIYTRVDNSQITEAVLNSHPRGKSVVNP